MDNTKVLIEKYLDHKFGDNEIEGKSSLRNMLQVFEGFLVKNKKSISNATMADIQRLTGLLIGQNMQKDKIKSLTNEIYHLFYFLFEEELIPGENWVSTLPLFDNLKEEDLESNENKREFKRILFRSKSIFYSEDTGFQMFGRTSDVCFNGSFFHFYDEPPNLAIGETGFLQIALHDFLPIESKYVIFYCTIKRITGQGIGLSFSKTNKDFQEFLKQISTHKVFVKRSSGEIDPGWDVLPNSHSASDVVNKQLGKHSNKGVVAICYKKGNPGIPDRYKIVSLKELKSIQDQALYDDVEKVVVDT
jgi:hypothetical protein